MKECRTCHETKPLSNFEPWPLDTWQQQGTPSAWCRSCVVADPVGWASWVNQHKPHWEREG